MGAFVSSWRPAAAAAKYVIVYWLLRCSLYNSKSPCVVLFCFFVYARPCELCQKPSSVTIQTLRFCAECVICQEVLCKRVCHVVWEDDGTGWNFLCSDHACSYPDPKRGYPRPTGRTYPVVPEVSATVHITETSAATQSAIQL
jgi:hypothetical protein